MLDGGGWSTPRPGRFTLGKVTRDPLCRRMGGPQGRSGRVWKISLPPTFDPQTIQPVACRYTDWAVPAHFLNSKISALPPQTAFVCPSTLTTTSVSMNIFGRLVAALIENRVLWEVRTTLLVFRLVSGIRLCNAFLNAYMCFVRSPVGNKFWNI